MNKFLFSKYIPVEAPTIPLHIWEIVFLQMKTLLLGC